MKLSAYDIPQAFNSTKARTILSHSSLSASITNKRHNNAFMSLETSPHIAQELLWKISAVERHVSHNTVRNNSESGEEAGILDRKKNR